MGGYYAPRSAAFEKRVKACIALSGPYNMGRNWDTIPDLTREAIRVRSHAKTQEEGRKNALIGAGSRALSALPIFPTTDSTSGTLAMARSCFALTSIAGPSPVCGSREGM